jgi:hypothetical protein
MNPSSIAALHFAHVGAGISGDEEDSPRIMVAFTRD